MLSEKEYAARSATVNAKYDEKIRQCQTSFLALKISLTRDMGRDEVGLYLQRMTKLNFKEDAEMLKIEFDREEEQRDLAKKAGAPEKPKILDPSAPRQGCAASTSTSGNASSRAVAVGALAGIARGLLKPEDAATRQEIDRWVAKFEASNDA